MRTWARVGNRTYFSRMSVNTEPSEGRLMLWDSGWVNLPFRVDSDVFPSSHTTNPSSQSESRQLGVRPERHLCSDTSLPRKGLNYRDSQSFKCHFLKSYWQTEVVLPQTLFLLALLTPINTTEEDQCRSAERHLINPTESSTWTQLDSLILVLLLSSLVVVVEPSGKWGCDIIASSRVGMFAKTTMWFRFTNNWCVQNTRWEIWCSKNVYKKDLIFSIDQVAYWWNPFGKDKGWLWPRFIWIWVFVNFGATINSQKIFLNISFVEMSIRKLSRKPERQHKSVLFI